MSIMKELSNTERDLAPEWAVYFVTDDNDVLFLSACKSRACWLVEDSGIECGFDLQDEFDIVGDYEELLEDLNSIKKPFDITKHEVANHVTVLGSGELVADSRGWIIDKDRAIAIAKALGVTGDDL